MRAAPSRGALYLQLLATRLNTFAAGEARGDFLVGSVIAEVTRQLIQLADVESGNAARAEMLAKMEESGAEIPKSFRDRMRPPGQAEADALTDDLNRGVDACEAALPDAVFDDWMLRSVKRS